MKYSIGYNVNTKSFMVHDPNKREMTTEYHGYLSMNVFRIGISEYNEHILEFVRDHSESVMIIDNGEITEEIAFFCIDSDIEVMIKMML